MELIIIHLMQSFLIRYKPNLYLIIKMGRSLKLIIIIGCLSIRLSASISICSVAVISFFLTSSKFIFWSEELLSSGLKLDYSSFQKHMVFSSMQIPFGKRNVQFLTRILSRGNSETKYTQTEILGDSKNEGQMENYFI